MLSIRFFKSGDVIVVHLRTEMMTKPVQGSAFVNERGMLTNWLVYGKLIVKLHMHVYDYLTCTEVYYVALWYCPSAYRITIAVHVGLYTCEMS